MNLLLALGIIQLFLVLKVNSLQFGHLFLQTRTNYTIIFYIPKIEIC